MDFLWDKITEWLKDVLISGITSNLSGMFDATNQKVAEISGEVGLTPQAWNGSIFNTLEKIALSSGGYQTELFMKEAQTNDGIELVRTTKYEFESQLLAPKVFNPLDIAVVNEENETLYDPLMNASPKNVTENVDGGTVRVLTSFYRVEDNIQPSHFMVVSSQVRNCV